MDAHISCEPAYLMGCRLVSNRLITTTYSLRSPVLANKRRKLVLTPVFANHRCMWFAEFAGNDRFSAVRSFIVGGYVISVTAISLGKHYAIGHKG